MKMKKISAYWELPHKNFGLLVSYYENSAYWELWNFGLLGTREIRPTGNLHFRPTEILPF